MDGLHPLVPERIPPPDPFVSRFGLRGVLLVFLVKVAFGAFVGGFYGGVSGRKKRESRAAA
jgi:hypothetical protein